MNTNNFTEQDKINVIQLVLKSEDELLQQLGEFEHKAGLPSDLIKWGRERLNNIIAVSKDQICKSEVIQTLCRSDETKDNTDLILSIAAIIKSVAASVPYILVAVLITRFGVKKLCKSKWDEFQ